MGTAEGRSLAGVIAGVLLGVGIPQCVSAPILGWLCIVVALLLLLSLYLGWPLKSLQIGRADGSMDGVPLVAPLSYKVDQLRQVIPQFGDVGINTWMLQKLLPKMERKRRKALYEPLPGVSMDVALNYLVSTGELVMIGKIYRPTGKKIPLRLRWKHGKDAEA